MDILVTATVAFLFAGFVKGVLGFGFPIIALVVMTLTIGLLDALAYIVVPTIATNLWQAMSGPHLRAILQRMWVYFLCAVIGILVSSQFLAIADVNWLTGLLGVVLFAFALSRLMDVHLTVQPSWERGVSVALGTVNGLLTGLTGTFMVPSVLYMQAIGFDKDTLVQALGAFFALSTITLTLSLGQNDLITIEQALTSTAGLVPAFIGIYAGRWTREQIDEEYFQRLFLSALLMLGGYLAIRAVFVFV